MNTTKTATKNVGINEMDSDYASPKDKKPQGNKFGHVWLYSKILNGRGKTLDDKQNSVAF